MAVLHQGSKDRSPARVGQVLRGKWRLDELLAVGGMASVFSATHRNGKRGAVKLLHYELSLNEESKGRFLREGYVANKVGHDGAVSVLDDDVCDDGTVFLVMELLEGQTVDALLRARKSKSFGLGETLRVTDRLLDVLAAAHDKGIVHRDIKPENLFVTADGRLKVLDFGIARLREAHANSGSTRAGDLLGTPSFMPPEQALGNSDQIDARSDVWSAGATAFRLLTGRTVHQAESVNRVLLAAMTMPAPPIGRILPTVPPELAGLVDRALAFEQKDRWPDARSMRAAVRAFADRSGLRIEGPIPNTPDEARARPTTLPLDALPHLEPYGPAMAGPQPTPAPLSGPALTPVPVLAPPAARYAPPPPPQAPAPTVREVYTAAPQGVHTPAASPYAPPPALPPAGLEMAMPLPADPDDEQEAKTRLRTTGMTPIVRPFAAVPVAVAPAAASAPIAAPAAPAPAAPPAAAPPASASPSVDAPLKSPVPPHFPTFSTAAPVSRDPTFGNPRSRRRSVGLVLGLGSAAVVGGVLALVLARGDDSATGAAQTASATVAEVAPPPPSAPRASAPSDAPAPSASASSAASSAPSGAPKGQSPAASASASSKPQSSGSKHPAGGGPKQDPFSSRKW